MLKLLNTVLLTLLSLSEAPVLPREDINHTACSGNRGQAPILPQHPVGSNHCHRNIAADVESAIRDVIQKVESYTAKPLEANECLYTISHSTVVSVCNGAAPGRIITVAEAQSDLDAIVSMCGSQGNYNGSHYSNDLKLKDLRYQWRTMLAIPRTPRGDESGAGPFSP